MKYEKIFKAIIITLVFLKIVDLITTYLNMNRGAIEVGEPFKHILPIWGFLGMGAYMLFQIIAIFLLYWLYKKPYRSPQTARDMRIICWIGALSCLGVYTFMAINNISILIFLTKI